MAVSVGFRIGMLERELEVGDLGKVFGNLL